MNAIRRTLHLPAALAIAFALSASPLAAQAPPSWAPISAQDLALKDSPVSPGEPAMILHYEVVNDNSNSSETIFKRIKIFREEGKKFADIEIAYFEKETQVEDIRGSVTSPDGKTENFSGVIYDKEIVKMKKFRWSAKTFTLPNVGVGSIIEYSYRLHWHAKFPDVLRNPSSYRITEAFAFAAARWPIQHELSVLYSHFVLHPIKGARSITVKHNLPTDAILRNLPDGTVELTVEKIPAIQKEDFSPPEDSLMIRADVFYILGFYSDPKYYWQGLAKRQAESLDAFIGKPKDVQKEVDKLLSPGDSEETKLRKIYDRVQQIRALAYEPEKTKKERKQLNLKENKNAEDVLSHGYAFEHEINWTFVALARAAGFWAYPLRIASRNRSVFTPERPDARQLTSSAVEVVVPSGTIFLDPETPYCRFGLLPWEDTDAGGIRLDRSSGQIESTPKPKSTEAITRRNADLKVDADGNLEGILTITFDGQEALSRRIHAIDLDEAARRKILEEAVQRLLAQGSVVKLISAEPWQASESPLKAQFQIQVPNYATKTGQRLVLPLGIFHSNIKNPFASVRRTNPIAFEYPYERYEEITMALPPDWQIESLPSRTILDRGAAFYESSVEKQGNLLRLKRTIKMQFYYLPADRYLVLRRFFDEVRTGDEQQAILKPVQDALKN